jgi:putative transposase
MGGLPAAQRRGMIEVHHKFLSVRCQTKLLSLARSVVYYKPCKSATSDVCAANEILEIWTESPFYGRRRIAAALHRLGHVVNEKRVRRLMREMKIEAIYPKPKLSQGNIAHKKYQYLLRDMDISRANQAWCTDITYIKIASGFVYLVALIDVYSRYVVAWKLSIALDTEFCLNMLKCGLSKAIPGVINTDQGCQFTSAAWIEAVEFAGVSVSMDGRGRWADNIPIERFWRTVKYENVFLQCFENVTDARQKLGEYIEFYNERRLHQSLDYATPAEVWRGVHSAAPFRFKKLEEKVFEKIAA